MGHRRAWRVSRVTSRMCRVPLCVNHLSHPRSVCPFLESQSYAKKKKEKKKLHSPQERPLARQVLPRTRFWSPGCRTPPSVSGHPAWMALPAPCHPSPTTREGLEHEKPEEGIPKHGRALGGKEAYWELGLLV